ncbi:MAG: response regulator, partial [Chloroflexota bacterium]
MAQADQTILADQSNAGNAATAGLPEGHHFWSSCCVSSGSARAQERIVDLRDRRLVIADDDRRILKLLAETIVEMTGISVRVVPDGEKLLECLSVPPLPDLAVIDVRMPGIDG